MSAFYRAMACMDPDARNVIKTVIAGQHLGEKALFADGMLAAESVPGGFFAAHPGDAQGSGPYEEIAGETVFVETPGQTKKLVICGGGHVSMPIIRMGKMIGCAVTVLEDRPSFADAARAAGADAVVCDSFANGLAQIRGDADTYFVIVTRGHRYDMDCLRAALGKRHAYIGMMGSRRRVGIIRRQLLEEGFDPALVDGVHAPIGLDIAAKTPEEIAVSVLAQIIDVKNRSGRGDAFPPDILRAMEDEGSGRACVLATIVRKRGAAPREPGTRMLVLPDGRTVGTIGGGCAEADIVRAARTMLALSDSTAQLRSVDMTAEEAEGEGMVCGGVIDVLLEIVR